MIAVVGRLRSLGTETRLVIAALWLIPSLFACVVDDVEEGTGTATIVANEPVASSAPRVPPEASRKQSSTSSPNPAPAIADVVDSGRLDITRDEGLNADGHYDDVRITDDGTRTLIPLEAIEWGGVAKDGIPALDQPDYVGSDRWNQMVYDPDGLVIGVEVDRKYRAYPLQILIWHEIVNETFEGKHLLVTY